MCFSQTQNTDKRERRNQWEVQSETFPQSGVCQQGTRRLREAAADYSQRSARHRQPARADHRLNNNEPHESEEVCQSEAPDELPAQQEGESEKVKQVTCEVQVHQPKTS